MVRALVNIFEGIFKRSERDGTLNIDVAVISNEIVKDNE